jgi:hypothetical protein
MPRVGFVAILSAGPVGADVALMEEVETDGVLVLGNGCWTTMRSDVLQPIRQGFTDGRLQRWLCLCGDQVLGQLSEKIRSPLVLLGAEEKMALCL